jgi:nitrile hydratase alpha subunit
MKDTDRNRAVLAEVIARSWRDPAFRASLKANPKQAVTAAGMQIPPNVEVVLLENTATIVHAVLPPRADMARYQARFDATVKKWFDMPDDLEIRVRRDSPQRIFVVIPAAPAKGTGALSDRQLEQVAGGGATATYQTVVGVTTAVQTAEAVTTAAAAQDAVVASTVAGVAEVAAAVAAVVAPCFVS